jgi:hypothetical protein
MFKPRVVFKMQASPVVLGEEAMIELECTSDESIDVDGLTVELVCVEQSLRDPGILQRSHGPKHETHTFERPMWVKEIHRGITRFSVPVTLPLDVTTTFEHPSARCDWFVRVHLAIRWALDVHESFPITVLAPVNKSAGDDSRDVFRWFVTEASPLIECALSSSTLAPGEPFEVCVALSQIAQHKILQIDLQVLSLEERFGADERPTTEDVHGWLLHRGALAEGELVRRTLRVPGYVQPTLESKVLSLRYELAVQVVTEAPQPVTRRFPVTVVDPSNLPAPATTHGLVGRERVDRVWAEIVRLLSHTFESITANSDERRVEINIGSARVVLGEGLHPVFGPCLTVRIGSAPRALDLRIQRNIGEAQSAQLEVHVREPAQIQRAFSGTLLSLAQRVDAFLLDDQQAMLWFAQPQLLASNAPSIVDAIQTFAEQMVLFEERTSPPAALKRLLESARAFCERNRCELRVGDLSVSGWTVHGRGLRFFYRFHGPRPTETVVQMTESHAEKSLPTDEDIEYVAEGCRRSVSLEDGRWTMTVPKVQSIVECDDAAGAFVRAISMLWRRERGPFR